MEIALLIVVIFILIFQNKKYSKESLNLKKDLHVLNEKLNSLLAPHKEGAKTAAKEMVQEVVRKTVVPTPEVLIKERPTPETPPIPELSKAESARVAASAKTVMTAAPAKKVAQGPTLSFWQRFKQRNPDLEKFVGENLINKIGILILVLGI